MQHAVRSGAPIRHMYHWKTMVLLATHSWWWNSVTLLLGLSGVEWSWYPPYSILETYFCFFCFFLCCFSFCFGNEVIHSFIHSFKKAPLWSRWPSFRFWRDCGSFSLWISYFTPFAFRAYWKVFFFSYITLASVFSNQPSLIKVSVVIALCSAFTLNPNKNQSILIFMLKSCVLSQLGCVK